MSKICLTSTAALHANRGLALHASDYEATPPEDGFGRDEFASVSLPNGDARSSVASPNNAKFVATTASHLHRNLAFVATTADTHHESYHVLHDTFASVAASTMTVHTQGTYCKKTSMLFCLFISDFSRIDRILIENYKKSVILR